MPQQPFAVTHSDSVDVAVLPMSAILNQMAAINAPPFLRAVDLENCMTAEQSRDLDAVEQVLFIGYPSGIYDRANLLPIARVGTTATPVKVDYEGLPAFLVDAAVFPGSSGSPVFLRDASGIAQTRDGSIVVATGLMLLGVLAAVHTTQVEGQVVHLPAQQKVHVNTPIGLGIVYKASSVVTCIDQALIEVGLKRIGASPEPG